MCRRPAPRINCRLTSGASFALCRMRRKERGESKEREESRTRRRRGHAARRRRLRRERQRAGRASPQRTLVASGIRLLSHFPAHAAALRLQRPSWVAADWSQGRAGRFGLRLNGTTPPARDVCERRPIGSEAELLWARGARIYPLPRRLPEGGRRRGRRPTPPSRPPALQHITAALVSRFTAKLPNGRHSDIGGKIWL